MQKTVLSIALLLMLLPHSQVRAGCGCAVGKEYLRCAYYVEKKGDLAQQHSCLTYASGLLEGESPGRASWYFVVGGAFDKAIDAAQKAISRGEYYAYESLGEAWLLKGDIQKAKKAFTGLRTKVPGFELLRDKHFRTLQKLYPKKWDTQTAKALF